MRKIIIFITTILVICDKGALHIIRMNYKSISVLLKFHFVFLFFFFVKYNKFVSIKFQLDVHTIYEMRFLNLNDKNKLFFRSIFE